MRRGAGSTYLTKSFSGHQKVEFLALFSFELHPMQRGSTEPGKSKQSRTEQVRSSAVESRVEISQRNEDAQDQQSSSTPRLVGCAHALSFVCCSVACFSCLAVSISGGLAPWVTFAEKGKAMILVPYLKCSSFRFLPTKTLQSSSLEVF